MQENRAKRGDVLFGSMKGSECRRTGRNVVLPRLAVWRVPNAGEQGETWCCPAWQYEGLRMQENRAKRGVAPFGSMKGSECARTGR